MNDDTTQPNGKPPRPKRPPGGYKRPKKRPPAGRSKRTRKTAAAMLSDAERASKVIEMIREGIPRHEIAKRIGCSESLVYSDFIAYFGFRVEENLELAHEARAKILRETLLDQEHWRFMSLAASKGFAAIAMAGDIAGMADADIANMVALSREARAWLETATDLLGMGASAEAAHESRNLRGSGVATIEELRERIGQSPALADKLLESGVYAQLQVRAAQIKERESATTQESPTTP